MCKPSLARWARLLFRGPAEPDGSRMVDDQDNTSDNDTGMTRMKTMLKMTVLCQEYDDSSVMAYDLHDAEARASQLLLGSHWGGGACFHLRPSIKAASGSVSAASTLSCQFGSCNPIRLPPLHSLPHSFPRPKKSHSSVARTASVGRPPPGPRGPRRSFPKLQGASDSSARLFFLGVGGVFDSMFFLV